MNVALAGQAGTNLVYESAGMLGSLMSCSLEAMVIDNDMLGAINRTVRGIEVNEETLSVDVIKEVVHGAGHFLGSQQTLELMQREYIYPILGDRESPDNWMDAGGKDQCSRYTRTISTPNATRPSETSFQSSSNVPASTEA